MKFLTLAVFSVLLVPVVSQFCQAQSNTTATAVAPVAAAPRGNTGTLDASGQWNPQPLYTTHPEAYSGLSGPGGRWLGRLPHRQGWHDV